MKDALHPKRTALIVVDMQNAYLHEEGSFARLWPQAKDVEPGQASKAPIVTVRQFDLSLLRQAIPGCSRLVQSARKAKVPVVYLRYVYRSDYQDGGVLIQEIHPEFVSVGYIAEGTWDAEIVDELKPELGDIVVEKARYSGFHATRLETVLRSLGAETLIICGVTTHFCVECTARDAHMRDYRVIIASDATNEVNDVWKQTSLASFATGFGWVQTVEDIVTHWSGNPAKALVEQQT